MVEDQALAALGALSERTRLRIVTFLVRKGADGAPAGDIGAAVDATSSRLSFHLSALEKAGLVTSRRVSRNIIYAADFEALGGLVGFLLHECCGGHPTVRACCAPGPGAGEC